MPSGRRPVRDCLLRAPKDLRVRDLVEEAGTRGAITRREFLRIGALAGAFLALPGCTRDSSIATTAAPGRSTDLTVGIVGAGLAGLTAAYWLNQSGVRPVVFEAADRIGGRCWSARDFDAGQIGEHGGEFIDSRHVHIRAMVDEVGLQLDDLWSTWLDESTWLQQVDGNVSEALEEYEWMTQAVTRLQELAALGPLGAGEGPPELIALDEMTAEEWYRADVGPTDDGRYRLWARDLSTWYGLDPDRLGAGNLIDFYATEYSGADERWTIDGGNDLLPANIAESLPDGTITLDAPLERVSVDDAGTVELLVGGGVGSVTLDRVVLATPFTTLREVDLEGARFSPGMTSAIEELEMGTNAKVLMQFDRPFFTGFGDWSGSLNRADAPLFGTWESGSTDGQAQAGLLTVYTGGRVGAGYAPSSPHGVAPDQVVADTLAALAEAVPEISDAYNGQAWLDSWVDDTWARGSYAAFGPGQTYRFWGTLGEAQGPIHMAGEQSSIHSQGYLNGGVESGCRVAAEILEEVGIPLAPGLQQIRRAEQEQA